MNQLNQVNNCILNVQQAGHFFFFSRPIARTLRNHDLSHGHVENIVKYKNKLQKVFDVEIFYIRLVKIFNNNKVQYNFGEIIKNII